MPDNHITLIALAFLLVLTRVLGVFTFLPIPGFKAGPDMARLLFAVALSIALFPAAPPLTVIPGPGTLAFWMFQELAFGLTVGVALSFLAEGTQLAAQQVGLQAGFSLASTIDPTTQADSSVLSILTELLTGLIFFSLGLHREVILVFARSLQTWPPGTFFLTLPVADGVWRLGTAMLSMGVRLAMPVIALLLIVDVTFSVLGKINTQIHMMSLSFPAKMLAGMVVFSAALAGLPLLFRGFAAQTMNVLLHMAEH